MIIKPTPSQRLLVTCSFKNKAEANNMKILLALDNGAAILRGVIDKKASHTITSSSMASAPNMITLEAVARFSVSQWPCQPDKAGNEK